MAQIQNCSMDLLKCKAGDKQWKMVTYVRMTLNKIAVYLPSLMDTEVQM